MNEFVDFFLVDLGCVRLCELYCSTIFKRTDFGDIARSFSIIFTNMEESIWGMGGLIHPLKTAKIVHNV